MGKPLTHFLPMRSLHGSLDPLLFFFFFFSNEIYRRVKIGLWIWFITTKLFGWILLPPCPWSSQESFTWHPATSHSISPSLSLFLWFCGAELIPVNFWKALCYTVKWVSKQVTREEVSDWWDVIICYSIFWDLQCLATNIVTFTFCQQTPFHIMLLPTSICKVINKAWAGNYLWMFFSKLFWNTLQYFSWKLDTVFCICVKEQKRSSKTQFYDL